MRRISPHPHLVDWGQPIDWGHPLNRGLVWWYAAVPSRMGFGGNVWREMRHQNYGVFHNGWTPATAWNPVPGGVRGSLTFSGSNYVTIPDGNYGIANGYTLACWFKLASAPAAISSLFGRDDTSGSRFWQFRITTAGKVSFIRFNSGNSVASNFAGATNFCDGNYHYAMATFTGAGSVIYVDGKSDGSDAVTTANKDGTGTAPAMGARSDPQNGNDNLTGSLNDVQLWNRGFSAVEAREAYRVAKLGQYERLRMIVPLQMYGFITASTFVDNTTPYLSHILACDRHEELPC